MASVEYPTPPSITLNDLVVAGRISPPLANFLTAAVLAKCNIIVAGGMWSGRTAVLNCLCSAIPGSDRIALIEDIPEISVLDQARYPDLTSLSVTIPIPAGISPLIVAFLQGMPKPTLSELVLHALRYDPDRLIVGEIVGAEVMPILASMLGLRRSGSSLEPEMREGPAPAVMATLHHPQGTGDILLHLAGCSRAFISPFTYAEEMHKPPQEIRNANENICAVAAQVVDLVVVVKGSLQSVPRVVAVDEIVGMKTPCHAETVRIWKARDKSLAKHVASPSDLMATRLHAAGWLA